MKKYIVFIILLIIMPLQVKAVNYKITDQLINADILSNGDLKISELIVMDGTFNGYEKTLSFENNLLEDNPSSALNNKIYNASSLELLEIKGKVVDKVDFNTFNDRDFKVFRKEAYASNGDKEVYTMVNNGDGYTYKLYFPAHKGKVAFLISYVVHDVALRHPDVAEVYWNFITPNYYDDIENVQVKVNLPQVDNSSDLRYWAHGDLAGEIRCEDNKTIKASINKMASTSVLDIRLTFNKDLIDMENIKYSNLTLEDIIKVEEQRALVANNLRKELIRKRNTTICLTLITYISMIGIGIYAYFKYGKSPKSTYFSKYNREFIDDYNVEVVDYLMNKKITPNAMSASIMNLIYKKNITALEIPTDKKVKDYTFILENEDNINETEKLLIDFLFKTVSKKTNSDNKAIFTTFDLKKYANGTRSCNTFINNYTNWKNKVINDGEKENFYERSNVPKLIGVIMLIISILVFLYGRKSGVDFIPNYLLIMIGIIFTFIMFLMDKKTIKGVEHYDKWKAFKNFLNDFGVFELKELPEIALWERYLVYATVFGLADKVQKSMNVKIQELDLNNLNYDYNMPTFIYINIADTISSSVSNAINSAYQRQAANYSNTHSSMSSGSGFGGGFSSGGGFGGGGSSGHGF